MKKIIFTVGAVAIGLVLSGCQTTNNKQQVDTLSNRVQILESTIQDRDRELSQLQGQIDQLSQQVIEQEKTARARQQALAAAPLTNKDHLGIIKVPVKATDVQSALKSAGFYNGEIDGKVGANTISAIAAFQKANNIPVDSIVGPKTWDLLRTHLN
jgi:outer membrane murein-binding lipoprotein Lpp